jgi:iron complex outermembrane recepter protein
MTRKILALVLLCCCTRIAAGQDTPGDTAWYKLSPLIVSATRTPQRTIYAPFALTIVRKAEFRSSNGLRVDAALRNVPGVLAQSRYGTSDTRVIIRGFGARGAGDRSNAGTTRGVRFLQDGFPETEPDGRTALDLLDLAATTGVEVIRSNATVLWGNAAGGLIDFSTIPASPNSAVTAEYQGGAFGLKREVLRMQGPFGSSLLYGTLTRTEQDGWRKWSQAERSYVNVGLTSDITSSTHLNAHLVAADNQFHIPGPLTMAQLEADPRQANATYASRRERRRNRLGRLALALQHDIATERALGGAVFVNPKFLQRSERGTFRDFTRYHFGGNTTFRAGHQLSARVHGTLFTGLDEAYQDGAILFYGLTADGERARDLRENKREGANNFGAFAQEMLAIGGRLEVTVGARYDNISYYYESRIDPDLNSNKSFKRVTPKLGAMYKLSPSHTLYANVGGGVEAPAGNETDPAGTFGADTVYAINPLLDPIHSTTAEIGTKHVRTFAAGLLRTLSYDVALYRTDVKNEIIPYRGGRFYFTAGKAQRQGLEIGARVSTAYGVGLGTSWTFSNNEYQEYMVDSVHYSAARAGHFADYSGNKIVGIPGRFFNVRAEYAPPFAKAIGLELETQNIASYFADDANRVKVSGYALWHAGIDLEGPARLGGGLELRGALRVENLTNKKYVASAFLNPDVVNGVPVAFEPGMPRHLVVSASLGWARR